MLTEDDTIQTILGLPTILLQYLDLQSLLNLRAANREWLQLINKHAYPLPDYTIVNCAIGGGVRKIDTDYSYVVFVFKDGSVFSFGNNAVGQLGLGDDIPRLLPTRISNIRFEQKQVTQSAAGITLTLFLCSEGSMFYCGNDGTGPTSYYPYNAGNTVFENKRVIQIRKKFDTTFHLCEDGTVYADGNNEWGELGLNDFNPRIIPTLIDSAHFLGKKVIQCWPGPRRSFFLCDDNSVFISGGEREQPNAAIPRQIDKALFENKEIVQCAVGFNHCIVICADGNVFTFGDNTNGQLGHNDTLERLLPTRIDNVHFAGRKVIQSAAGARHSIFVCDDGSVYSCGNNRLGQLAQENIQNSLISIRINAAYFEGRRVVQSLCNDFSTLFICDNSTVYACGAINNTSIPQRIPNPLYTPHHEATAISKLLLEQVTALNALDLVFAKALGNQVKQILTDTVFYPAIPDALCRAVNILNRGKNIVTITETEKQKAQPVFSPLFNAAKGQMETMEKRAERLKAVDKIMKG